MSSKITFYIARHGKTLLNTLDRVQGWCDSPLTPEGIEVAEFLGEGMKNIHIDSVYTSDLRRTRQTAEIILKEKGQADLPITEKSGFREACFGKYESDSNVKMWTDVALYLQYLKLDDMNRDLFNGTISSKDTLEVISKLDHMGMAETFEQIETRMQDTITEIARAESADGKDKNILIVAHGMCIICLLYNWGGDALLKAYLDNASICEVTYQDGKFTVHSMGDMTHVHTGRAARNK